MTKLTQAQRDALSATQMTWNRATNTVWRGVSNGAVTRVPVGTFNALCLRKLIACIGTRGNDSFYNITEAGRAALSEEQQR